MTFTLEHLEFYLLILMRVSGFIMTAPFFSYSSVPMRIRAAMSVFMSLVVIQVTPVVDLTYSGVFGYSALVLKESMIGVVLGLMCSMCFYIINLAGQLMDMEMGLSMANMFDPMVNMQFSVTGSLYNYLLMLMLVVTNMHYYIIRAIVDSFSYFNVGKAVFDTVSLKNIVVDFIANYFIIAVRIVMPVFCCMLLINVVLGVLAKAAPQMNMFVVGMQIKVLAGLAVLVIVIQSFPMVSDYIFGEMKDVITQVIHLFTPK